MKLGPEISMTSDGKIQPTQKVKSALVYLKVSDKLYQPLGSAAAMAAKSSSPSESWWCCRFFFLVFSPLNLSFLEIMAVSGMAYVSRGLSGVVGWL